MRNSLPSSPSPPPSSSSSSSSMAMIQHSSPCLPLLSSRKQQRNLKLLPFSRPLLAKPPTSNRMMEFRFSHCTGQRASKHLIHDLSGFITLKRSLLNNHLNRPHPNVGDSSDPNVPYNSLLTFVLLFGCFALQGSQPALAISEFSSALKSITNLWDIGEIKTGFASVRRIFLELCKFGETDLPLDDIAAVCLLLYFGISTLIDATSGDDLKADEEQKEAELAVSDFSGNGAGILAAASTVASTFLLVFVAEWGDMSFFSTIALAAASSPLGVTGGALAGHGVATLLAVLGGSLLGTFLSEKIIAYIGGSLFLVFALVTVIDIVP